MLTYRVVLEGQYVFINQSMETLSQVHQCHLNILPIKTGTHGFDIRIKCPYHSATSLKPIHSCEALITRHTHYIHSKTQKITFEQYYSQFF